MEEILFNPAFLIPAGFGTSFFLGFIVLPKLIKNGNVKQKECGTYRMEHMKELGVIEGRLERIEGYLEGIYGKKIKK